MPAGFPIPDEKARADGIRAYTDTSYLERPPEELAGAYLEALGREEWTAAQHALNRMQAQLSHLKAAAG